MLNCEYIDEKIINDFIYEYDLRDSISAVQIVMKIDKKLQIFDGHWPQKYEDSIEFEHLGRKELIFFQVDSFENFGSQNGYFHSVSIFPSSYGHPDSNRPFVFYFESKLNLDKTQEEQQ